jgi:DNA-binding SARP family transcriptional activator
MDRMDEKHAVFRMYLLGPFSLVDGKGKSATPKSQKAQAILAMLALSARGSRSRVWLRDKLWSDRSEDQAAASLRQALLDIHKALGSARDLIIADKNTVWLDMDRIALDTEVVRTRSADTTLMRARAAGGFARRPARVRARLDKRPRKMIAGGADFFDNVAHFMLDTRFFSSIIYILYEGGSLRPPVVTTQ